jgi:uncharacterized membrane protein YdcZ (DUF606 family)
MGERESGMSTFLWMLVGFVVGAVMTFALGVFLPTIIGLPQAEGGYMMGVAFFWTPVGGVMGAITGLVARLTR